MVLRNQFSWFWYHSEALNETNTIPALIFKIEILKEIYNPIDNSENWWTVLLEPSLCQQSASEVLDLLRKCLDQSEILLQEFKICYRPICWSLNDPETSSISRRNFELLNDTKIMKTVSPVNFLEKFTFWSANILRWNRPSLVVFTICLYSKRSMVHGWCQG